MFNNIRYGLAVLGLLLPIISEAHQQCISQFANKSAVAAACDVSFTTIPTFTNLCLGVIEGGIYTIRNNTPVTIKINYIRIKNNDALPNLATAIVAAPNNCGKSLAAGASCNILLNLQPLAMGTFDRTLQIGINTRQIELDAPAITSAVNCVPVPVPPPTPVGPAAVPLPDVLVPAAILGTSTVTNIGPSVVTRDLDLSPGTSVTGFPPGTVIGTTNIANAAAAAVHLAASNFLVTLMGKPCTATLSGNLTGLTLTPGVYCFASSALLAGPLTLMGAANSAFIFKIPTALTVNSGSSVILTGGLTSASNINWAVGSSATIGTFSAFQGNIDAGASITLQTGASLKGRAWATGAAVTLDTNAVNPN